MFKAICLEDLDGVTGGCACDRSGQNTGITGGMDVPNNDVPKRKKARNTGITGGLDVPNNDVP